MTREDADTGAARSATSLLAHELESSSGRLIEMWERLGSAGPTLASPDAGSVEQARERYLRPLARVLIGALRGSRDHEAVYLDERTRYVDASLRPAERADFLRPLLTLEFREIAKLIGEVIVADKTIDALSNLHAPLLEPSEPVARLLFIGDCIFVETRAFLAPLAREAGRAVDVRHIFFSARQPLESANTSIVEEIASYRPDVIGLSPFTYEGIPPYSAAWRDAASPTRGFQALSLVNGLAELVRQTIQDIRSVSDAPIALHIPGGLTLDRVRRRIKFLPAHSLWQGLFLRRLTDRLDELLKATDNTIILYERELVNELGGVRQAAAPAFPSSDVSAGYFHTTRLGPKLGQFYDQLLQDYKLLAEAKVLLVDFDNTLWSGVMGDGDVVHNRAWQTLLKELKNSGVLLVALSKNSESTIRWDEMILTPDDFVLHKINWLPKPDNVASAIAELDLAPQTFRLLDDNPVERALVTEVVPGVLALDPAEPSSWRALTRWLDFPSTKATPEAQRRTLMYREASDRRASLAGGHDYASMMTSLNLTYTVRLATTVDVPRLLELVQRTNQFNTTTKRRSTAEVIELLCHDRMHLYVATLTDRFGDLGVVAAAVFDVSNGAFDSVIMSCRAMGFGLELALIRVIVDIEGVRPITGHFTATERNGPSADLFARSGFRMSNVNGWTLDEGMTPPSLPAWLRRL